MGMTYKKAGVDVEAGYKAVDLIKKHALSTFTKNVISDIGGFGGLFSLDLKGIDDPVLVAGTDGVGTKLKIAFLADKHDTIGVDCVAMCVNDVVCQGAMPLFFLDYLAIGKLEPAKVAEIVKGVADGCIESGCALIGGETAEMPGFYGSGEYDIAGFVVGIVSRNKIIDGKSIAEDDVLIGIESSGLHSNGFSLVRKLIEDKNISITDYDEELGKTLLEELLTPTKIYVSPVLKLNDTFQIKGLAHITGGGFVENIPRIIPEEFSVLIYKDSWPVKPIFKKISDWGNIEPREMYNTFNMGIGMVMVVDKLFANEAISMLKELSISSYIIGKVIKGNEKLEFV